MKLIVAAVLALVVAAALAAPADPRQAQILRSDLDQNPDGSYSSNVETDDGIKRQETGELKEVKDEENNSQRVVVVRGSYSYPDPDGKIHTVNYFADETGYHAEGEDVPKSA